MEYDNLNNLKLYIEKQFVKDPDTGRLKLKSEENRVFDYDNQSRQTFYKSEIFEYDDFGTKHKKSSDEIRNYYNELEGKEIYNKKVEIQQAWDVSTGEQTKNHKYDKREYLDKSGKTTSTVEEDGEIDSIGNYTTYTKYRTRFDYDNKGNLNTAVQEMTRKDPDTGEFITFKNKQTEYSYDTKGRLNSETETTYIQDPATGASVPLGRTTTIYEYDNKGTLKSKQITIERWENGRWDMRLNHTIDLSLGTQSEELKRVETWKQQNNIIHSIDISNIYDVFGKLMGYNLDINRLKTTVPTPTDVQDRIVTPTHPNWKHISAELFIRTSDIVIAELEPGVLHNGLSFKCDNTFSIVSLTPFAYIKEGDIKKINVSITSNGLITIFSEEASTTPAVIVITGLFVNSIPNVTRKFELTTNNNNKIQIGLMK